MLYVSTAASCLLYTGNANYSVVSLLRFFHCERYKRFHVIEWLTVNLFEIVHGKWLTIEVPVVPLYHNKIIHWSPKYSNRTVMQ